MVKYFIVAVVLLLSSSALARERPVVASQPALEALGKQVFFDPISQPTAQACASCHVPADGWTGGNSFVNATQVAIPGADPRTAGNRKPATASYASFSPHFGDSLFRTCSPTSSALSCRGGLFWDGRATGTIIGDEVFGGNAQLKAAYEAFLGPAADQALAPFSNDVEMNVPDGNDDGLPGAEFVCDHVQRAPYAELFDQAWGEPIDCDVSHVAVSFKRIAVAISAWEHSEEVNSFSSKRDFALAADADDSPGAFPLQGLTDQENLGHDLFFGVTSELNPEGKNAHCGACHNSGSAGSQGDEPKQLYTDERFHNIGVPPNYQAANFAPEQPDFGLAQHTNPGHPEQSPHAGRFRTPTLRNVDKRAWPGFIKAYMHNGYFKRLEDVVHFYNTASVKRDPERCPPGTSAATARARDCWPAPEFSDGIATGLVGDLGLTSDEEAAIVAYMKTLTDTETVTAPRRHSSRHRQQRIEHHGPAH